MCMQDEPPYDDLVAPEPTAPRRYVLSGERPAETEPRGSVALAVLGTMLSEAERLHALAPDSPSFNVQLSVLREARDKVAAAEAAL